VCDTVCVCWGGRLCEGEELLRSCLGRSVVPPIGAVQVHQRLACRPTGVSGNAGAPPGSPRTGGGGWNLKAPRDQHSGVFCDSGPQAETPHGWGREWWWGGRIACRRAAVRTRGVVPGRVADSASLSASDRGTNGPDSRGLLSLRVAPTS
jgi:hypothetical protein